MSASKPVAATAAEIAELRMFIVQHTGSNSNQRHALLDTVDALIAAGRRLPEEISE